MQIASIAGESAGIYAANAPVPVKTLLITPVEHSVLDGVPQLEGGVQGIAMPPQSGIVPSDAIHVEEGGIIGFGPQTARPDDPTTWKATWAEPTCVGGTRWHWGIRLGMWHCWRRLEQYDSRDCPTHQHGLCSAALCS